jgi:AraC-like DNA-binding protein
VSELPDDTRGILRPDAGRTRFSLERRLPSAALAPFVDRHWVVSWDLAGAPSYTQRIVPHPCINLVGEPGLIAVHGIPHHQSRHTIADAGVAVGTKFRPGGFAPFFGRPVHTLRDQVLPLGDVFGAAGAALEADLAAVAGEVDAHIAAVEAFLLARLPAPDDRLALVRDIVDAMRLAGPGITVGDLADRHAVSPRTLQRLFRDTVGVGPKWVLSRYRIHDAAERIASGEVTDPAELALDLGYFDQAHFTRDFTAQIGQAPVAYARACAAAAGRELAPSH